MGKFIYCFRFILGRFQNGVEKLEHKMFCPICNKEIVGAFSERFNIKTCPNGSCSYAVWEQRNDLSKLIEKAKQFNAYRETVQLLIYKKVIREDIFINMPSKVIFLREYYDFEKKEGSATIHYENQELGFELNKIDELIELLLKAKNIDLNKFKK